MARILAFVAAVALPIIAAFEAMLLGLLPTWAMGVVAALTTVPVILANPKQWTTTIGAVLAVFATHNAQAGARIVPITDPVVVDLVAGESAAGHEGEIVTIRGHLRDEWVLDEYRVAEGDRPDQNEAPPAVLIPLLPSADEAMPIDASTSVVVARIGGAEKRPEEAIELTGRVEKLPRALGESLFAATPGASAASERALVLDTVTVATPAQGLTLLAIAGVCALVGLWLMLVAQRRSTGAGSSVSTPQPKAGPTP